MAGADINTVRIVAQIIGTVRAGRAGRLPPVTQAGNPLAGVPTQVFCLDMTDPE